MLALVGLLAGVCLAEARDQVSLQQWAVEYRDGRATLVALADILDERGLPVDGLTSAQLAVHAPMLLKTVSVRQFDASDGVAYVVLVDVSGSLPAAQHAERVRALQRLIRGLTANDRMALVTFGDAVSVRQGFTAEQGPLLDVVNQLEATDRVTRLYEALAKAAELVRSTTPGLPVRRAIVLLSDGKNTAQDSGFREDDVVRSLEQEGAPLFAIDAATTRGTPACGQTMARLATVTDGVCEPLASRPIDVMYDRMRNAIRRAYVIEADCEPCEADGVARQLWVEVMLSNGVLRSRSRMVTVQPPPSPPPPAERPAVNWRRILIVAVLGLVVVGGVVVVALKLRKKEPPRQVDVAFDIQRTVAVTAPPPPPPRAPVMASLRFIVVGGRDSGRAYQAQLRDRLLIGRGAGCDVRLESEEGVADQHAEVTWADGHAYLRNVAPTGSTLVNGVPIRAPRAIEHRDTIRVGRIELRVLLDSGGLG
ncbi:MAG: VWA domain-containing protein [Vicinamibacterales bacterium]